MLVGRPDSALYVSACKSQIHLTWDKSSMLTVVGSDVKGLRPGFLPPLSSLSLLLPPPSSPSLPSMLFLLSCNSPVVSGRSPIIWPWPSKSNESSPSPSTSKSRYGLSSGPKSKWPDGGDVCRLFLLPLSDIVLREP